MQSPFRRSSKAGMSLVAALAITLPAIALSTPASAQLAPPWDGNPISRGLGPTYGEQWCADPAPGSSIANQQGSPLALIPFEAIACTLDRFNQKAADTGVPPRMTYSVIGSSDAGRELYGVVVNALETPEQQRDYDRWLQVRELMFSDPAGAQTLLESFGDDVKIPVFIEANIHGNEEESTDAMMQVVRDLVTLPYGTNAEVDSFLDHAILILIPSQNPDGRFLGTRQNANGFDMNRDLLVQSQPEIRANVALQQEWLAPVGLAMHGYVNPTLIDGLTKPHNPGIDYDLFLNWNQRRLDVNQAALADVGMGITRPVNQWNADAEDTPPPPVGPPYAEGWDDWGPFYTQTYMAFYGVDSSTLEMCSGGAGCNGRFGSKRAQYVGFYSSVGYWIENRNAILHDQLEIFRRGVTNAPRPDCCDDSLIAGRGFAEAEHNWMVPYPKAFVIPFGGGPSGKPFAFNDGQRSDAEANRLVQWLLDNGIEIDRTSQDLTWNGHTFAKKSYVVFMDQPLRGLAYTTLAAGQDVSDRITQLYAPPGAWSHGLLWGADTVEIPASDTEFDPLVNPIAAPNPLAGGVRGGGKADWYALTVRGAAEVRAVLDLLRSGVDGEVAESSFASASAGAMPAGSLIFPNDPTTVAALASAGLGAGVYFERGIGAKPATSDLTEAPKVAVLVNAANPSVNDTLWGLQRIFGSDAQFVSTISGSGSIQNAGTDPLAGFDVIYNAGQNFPSSVNIAAAPTGASEVDTTVTIQTTANHGLAAGSMVTIAGLPVAGYNGTFTVSGTPANNRFTYEAAVSGLASSGGGTVTYTSARNRLAAFFTGGGGYIGTSQSGNNFTFMVGAGLVNAIAQSSASAGGGIARWDNDGGLASPVTGGYPSADFLYLPSNVTYFSTKPADAVVDGTYQTPDATLFVAGLWRNRDSAASLAALDAPVIVHGPSLLGSRYVAYATNPFSRGDAEREWALIGQAALWSNLTDEV